jgi:hypothetical protein
MFLPGGASVLAHRSDSEQPILQAGEVRQKWREEHPQQEDEQQGDGAIKDAPGQLGHRIPPFCGIEKSQPDGLAYDFFELFFGVIYFE